MVHRQRHVTKFLTVLLLLLLLVVVTAIFQVSAALPGGEFSRNSRGIFSIGSNSQTRATLRPLSNVLFALSRNNRKQENAKEEDTKEQQQQQQQGRGSDSLARGRKSRTALNVAKIPSDQLVNNNDNNNDEDDEENKDDLSKLGHDRLGEVIYAKFGESVNFISSSSSSTGKNNKTNDPSYQFGDLTKWVDRQARTHVEQGLLLLSSSKNKETASQTERKRMTKQPQPPQPPQHNTNLVLPAWIPRPPFQKLYAKFGKTVNSVTSKMDPYEFGDLTTRWLNVLARSEVNDWTNKIAKKVQVAEWWDKRRRQEQHNEEEEDVVDGGGGREGDKAHVSSKKQYYNMMMYYSVSVPVEFLKLLRSIVLVQIIRVVVKLGVERQVLTRLPSSILMELVNLTLDGDYLPQILRVLATELDKRLKVAIMGDEDYRFGDLTKKSISKFTGKEQYKFGDITKGILERAQTRKTSSLAYSEEATARYKEQVQKELRVLEDYVRSLSAKGSNSSTSSSPTCTTFSTRQPLRGMMVIQRIPTVLLRWFQK